MRNFSNNSLTPTIIWFRQDLRLDDQPTLLAAIQKGLPIIPIYIWEPKETDKWLLGGASQWWLHHSLISLKNDLSELGLNLIIRHGPALQEIMSIIDQTDAKLVLWNRCYEPYSIRRDALIQSSLQQKGVETQSFNGSLLYAPWIILNQKNEPFQVFTPFWKQCLKTYEPAPPSQITSPPIPYNREIPSASIESLELLPKIHWDKGLAECWRPGEKYAKAKLKKDIESIIPHYSENRDFPAINGTSRLSPYLHFGEISPSTIWHAIKSRRDLDPIPAEAFLRQLGWREFGYYLLYHFPHTPEIPLKEKFANLPWENNPANLKAWQKGLTGYPIIDAGMRQLWKTGWMHNRVRMLVGSFLIKDLFIPWQEGEKWFRDTLVDADLANNTLGWQWVSGCGADAAPYFRIFNPILQGEKFDANGDYVKKWVPELADLPAKWIHKPWEAPEEVLRQAGITLGHNYPKPLVNHDEARVKALEAFSRLQ